MESEADDRPVRCSRANAMITRITVSRIAVAVAIAALPCCALATDDASRVESDVALQPGITMTTLELWDPAAIGGPRRIPIAIRKPLAITPRPVMVWSHGGATGKLDPLDSLPEWSAVTANAGYYTVSIAHVPRSCGQQTALCNALGATPCACDQDFKYLNWDRPHDIRVVLDYLETIASSDHLDLDSMALGGHSAGAGATMMLAGATRVYVTDPVAFVDPRPRAFLAFSPQGPGSEGFLDTSFGSVRRPVLVGTGDGDITDGDTPDVRRLAYDLSPGLNKYLVYIADARTRHTTFEHKTDACVRGGTDLATCQQFLDWLDQAALHFLDAKLRRNPTARDWLSSPTLSNLSNGVASIEQRNPPTPAQ
jgi:pimeloyl-ACP methyl ester carboxylesterase